MKSQKSILFIMLLMFGTGVKAATVFTDAVPILSAIPSAAGSVIVGANPTTNANPATCTNAGFLLSADIDGFKNLYASVLTALASGATVSFGLDDTNCNAGFPQIDGLIVNAP